MHIWIACTRIDVTNDCENTHAGLQEMPADLKRARKIRDQEHQTWLKDMPRGQPHLACLFEKYWHFACGSSLRGELNLERAAIRILSCDRNPLL